MANKTLFKSLAGKLIPATNAINEECAPAYALSPRHQLAQYAATGCLNRTFYATADEQLAKVLELCAEVDAEFIAKTAVFCRERGHMKDVPALLCAVLSVKDRELLAFVSDYESWVDAGGGRGTATMRGWNAFKERNPVARLACIDVQPYRTVQTQEREDILNVGGFSDQVFDVISEFARGELNADHWIGVIESVAL